MGFKMKIYQVGGAVRDRLLGKKAEDFDYVVVGGTPQELIDKGFQQVGKNFPVFLHPRTRDEYALARKEIKIGNKHTVGNLPAFRLDVTRFHPTNKPVKLSDETFADIP